MTLFTAKDDDHSPEQGLKSIRWPLRLTWAGIWAEVLVQAFWPLIALVLAVLAVLMLGLQVLMELAPDIAEDEEKLSTLFQEMCDFSGTNCVDQVGLPAPPCVTQQ